ncbi:hypothetical protein EDC29_104123 [Marichromatium gracile]|uniref:Uncharacterized protein n=1 Tax=Marichromatium gracile TaxID=1048 RepID=A0A4R4ACK5_MARGR|nr:hypothetical protein EDC29_104123 [Marichromatium gracile]
MLREGRGRPARSCSGLSSPSASTAPRDERALVLLEPSDGAADEAAAHDPYI